MPSDNDVKELASMIGDRYPTLKNCWGAMDGLNVAIEVPGSRDETQNMFYNGWKCDHFISNLFLFSPDGRICASYINAPGTVHDSTMAHMSGVYQKIDEIYARTNMKVVVDSAFASSERSSLVKSYQHNINRVGIAHQNNALNRDATSVRQMVEWGMRGLQGEFQRLKDKILWEEMGERKIILQLVVYLFNY